MSAGSPQGFLTRTCERSCEDHLEDFTKIPTRSSHKESYRTATKIFMSGPLRKSRKIAIKGPAAVGGDLARSWDKNLPRASQKSFHTSTSNTWYPRSSCNHLRERILPGSPQALLTKDLYKITRTWTAPGSPQDLLIRTCATSWKEDLHNICSQWPLQGLGQDLHVLRTSKTAPWTLARSFTKISENQPKISTAPQRERSDPHKVPRWLREHMSRDPPPANVLATPRKYHACHTDQECPISCTCHAKQRSRPQNASKAPCLPYEMDIAQKRAPRASKMTRPSETRTVFA